VLIAAGTGLGAQDQLRAAKDLYASAAYEDALTTLSHVDGGSTEITREVDQYRAFSLYALGRTREAESVAEAMIRKDPLARLDSVDASPRLEQMFTDVRKRLLPSLIRERFRTARGALDEKSFDSAKPQLTEARQMIADAEKLGVKDDGLGDLSVLIDGFLQLIRFESEKRPAANRCRKFGRSPVRNAVAPAAAGRPGDTSSGRDLGARSSPSSLPLAAPRTSAAPYLPTDDEGVSPSSRHRPAHAGDLGADERVIGVCA
jgi:hypothetical protein